MEEVVLVVGGLVGWHRCRWCLLEVVGSSVWHVVVRRGGCCGVLDELRGAHHLLVEGEVLVAPEPLEVSRLVVPLLLLDCGWVVFSGCGGGGCGGTVALNSVVSVIVRYCRGGCWRLSSGKGCLSDWSLASQQFPHLVLVLLILGLGELLRGDVVVIGVFPASVSIVEEVTRAASSIKSKDFFS